MVRGASVTGQPFVGEDSARFAGDRYARLRQAAAVAADDPAVADAPPPLDPAGLTACIDRIVEQRALDGLSGSDADWVSMALLLDFCAGPTALAERRRSLLDADAGCRVAGALGAVAEIVADVAAISLPDRERASGDH